MEIVISIIKITESILLLFFGFSSLYFLLFSASAWFFSQKVLPEPGPLYKIAIIIPAYKEDSVIVESVKSATGHHSKACRFKVWVAADQLQSTTLKKLSKTDAEVIEVHFKNSTKAKAINEVLKQISSDVEYIIILDADNIMQAGYIDAMAGMFGQGYRVVQGHRTAKNGNTSLAILDGMSEEVNNRIFRKGHRALGLSASIIGSAFGAERALFKETMAQITAIGGFDKELEMRFIRQGIKIGYADKAIVLDEKTHREDVFLNQRRRWLSAQIVYLKRNFPGALKLLVSKGRVDYFDKVLQYMLPPRIISLGFTFVMSILQLLLNIFTGAGTYDRAMMWGILFTINATAILQSVPPGQVNKKMIKVILAVPWVFLLTTKALLRIRGANHKFIHTPHSITNH